MMGKVCLLNIGEKEVEYYDSLEELLSDLSLEWGASITGDYLDIKWSNGEIQRLYKGKDY